VVPFAGNFDTFCRLSLAATFQSPAGGGPWSATLDVRLQQRVIPDGGPAGSWQTMTYILGDGASGNGKVVLSQTNVTMVQLAHAFPVAADHRAAYLAGSTIDVRAVWIQSGDYSDVLSSYVNESLENGGWHFEAWLAAAV
jgi:hypothetical protein